MFIDIRKQHLSFPRQQIAENWKNDVSYCYYSQQKF